MKMKINLYVGIACAILLHAGVILFGGALFRNRSKTHGTLQQVELLRDDDVAAEKKKPKEQELETEEKEAEDIPDADEIVRTWNYQPPPTRRSWKPPALAQSRRRLADKQAEATLPTRSVCRPAAALAARVKQARLAMELIARSTLLK